MANLIDETYFDDLDIYIPYDQEGITDVTAHVTKYEPEILKSALGSTLYELMIASPSASPYVEIIGGTDYTVDVGGVEHTVKWNGLQNTDKISLIAYYVYYWWQRNHVTRTVYSGEMQTEFENASKASVAMKVSSAWMRLKDLYGYPGQYELAPSLYNFLKENEDDYPTWIFNPLGFVNAFDL